jgi:hypothetical protein
MTQKWDGMFQAGGAHHRGHVPDGRAHAAGGVLPAAATQETALAGQHAAGKNAGCRSTQHTELILTLLEHLMVMLTMYFLHLHACPSHASRRQGASLQRMSDLTLDLTVQCCGAEQALLVPASLAVSGLGTYASVQQLVIKLQQKY